MRDAGTIFALSSGRPPAAVAVIRVSGPAAHKAGRALAGSLPEPRIAAVRTLRHPRTNEPLDDALMLRFDCPASVTGEDIVEFQCHGGRAVVAAVLDAMASLEGLRAAEPGEFTRRAFENGRIDLTQAEGLADLLEAETESQRKAALALAEGGLREQVACWQDQLLGLSAAAEQAIDYDEESDGAIEPTLRNGAAQLAEDLEDWLGRPRAERLKDGVRVVIAGPPNAGKSSLLNVLSGSERAIVTAVPGTTRDPIEVPLSISGLPILFVDTAGMRESRDEVEAMGIERAHQLVRAADLLLWMGEPAQAPDHPRRLLLHPKGDLSPGPKNSGKLPISSRTGQGIRPLMAWVEEQARSLLPTEGTVALNRRQANHLSEALQTLRDAAGAPDLVIMADGLRRARGAFDRLTGRAGVEDLLDALFSRFCLGK